MRIVIAHENITMTWYKMLFCIYSVVGLVTLHVFSESYLSAAPWFQSLSCFFGQYLPVINISPRISDFPNARNLYTITMFFSLIASFIYVVTSRSYVTQSAVDDASISKFIFGVCGSFLLSYLFVNILFFDGFSSVSADVSRAKAMELMMNKSKIGMSFFGAVFFDVFLIVIFIPFFYAALLYAKYFRSSC